MLSEMEQTKKQTGLAWRDLCQTMPYSTLMRWRRRARDGEDLVRTPGPQKMPSPNWNELYQSLLQLKHGPERTEGTTGVYRRYRSIVSRRQLQSMAAEIRREKLESMTRIQWLFPGLAWGIDATQLQGRWKLIPVYDLACRYHFSPLLAREENGAQIARHLEKIFRRHGAPLFLKRDNGSPFNCLKL